MRLFFAILVLSLLVIGCEDDAYIASANISKAADNFEINRRIVFYNGITDTYMLTIEGLCSLKADGLDKQLEVVCKVGVNDSGYGIYKKHFLGLSDNVSYISEHLDASTVSVNHYRITFKPQSVIPDIDLRGNPKELNPLTRPE